MNGRMGCYDTLSADSPGKCSHASHHVRFSTFLKVFFSSFFFPFFSPFFLHLFFKNISFSFFCFLFF